MTLRFITSLDIDECYRRLNGAFDLNRRLYVTLRTTDRNSTFEVSTVHYGRRNGITAHFFGTLQPFSTGSKITGYIGLRGKIVADVWFTLFLIGSLIAILMGTISQEFGITLFATLAFVLNLFGKREFNKAIYRSQGCLIDFLETTLEAIQLEPI